jgi:hypothetical protein
MIFAFFCPILLGYKIGQLDEKDKKQIYVVTALEVLGEFLAYNTKYNWKNKLNQRCVGFFFDLESAKNSVIRNDLDIYEHQYNVVVIEKSYEGFFNYGEPESDCWYKFNKQTEKYEKIEKPDCFKTSIGFGMG